MSQKSYYYDFASGAREDRGGGPHWIRGASLSRGFHFPLPTRVADFLEVALAVYAADRRSPRCFENERTGQREIRVRCGVRNPGLWSSVDVAERLGKFLYWLSEDNWSFEFVQRQTPSWSNEWDNFLFPAPLEQPVTVCLLSGGLDSVCGFASRYNQEPHGSVVLVSGYTSERLASQQQLQVELIRRALQDRAMTGKRPEIRHVAVPFGIWKTEAQREERSQRTRALVFLTLGVAAALQANAETLHVYENGIGALNLRVNETQLGVDNYRGVHPRSLIMLADLFELAFERRVRICNPCLFRTKAEMCVSLRAAGLVDLVQLTVSCDGFPQRVQRQAQCGYCTSCILRRQSLYVAGLTAHDPAEGYRHDVLNKATTLSHGQAFGLEATRDQIYRLTCCLASDAPWDSLASYFPLLAQTRAEFVARRYMSPDDFSIRILRLYQTYVQEWKSFPARIGVAS